MTIKNPKSYVHLEITAKLSAKFQVLIKAVIGVAGTRSEPARAMNPPKMAKTKTTCTSSDHKEIIYKISNLSDKKCKRS